jgi:hypothetical protein
MLRHFYYIAESFFVLLQWAQSFLWSCLPFFHCYSELIHFTIVLNHFWDRYSAQLFAKLLNHSKTSNAWARGGGSTAQSGWLTTLARGAWGHTGRRRLLSQSVGPLGPSDGSLVDHPRWWVAAPYIYIYIYIFGLIILYGNYAHWVLFGLSLIKILTRWIYPL